MISNSGNVNVYLRKTEISMKNLNVVVSFIGKMMKLVSCCCRYIEENYTKIRDVEREFGNLTMELKLTAGPKKAG